MEKLSFGEFNEVTIEEAPKIEIALPIIIPIIVNLFSMKKLDFKSIKD